MGSPPASTPEPENAATRKWSLLWSARIPLVLIAIGILLIAIAFVLYPRPETGIAFPGYPTVTIYTNAAIYRVQYSVVQAAPATAVLQIAIEQQTGFATGSSGTPVTPTVRVTLPLGFTFQDCPLYYCNNDPTIYGSTWYKTLSFRPAWATASFRINASRFGVNSDGVDAFAAIPEVDYQNRQYRSGLTTPKLFARYQIPSAASYDWSSFPTQSVTSTAAQWEEGIAKSTTSGTYGVTAGRIAPGIDHSREALNQNLTFAAGALLGLGGGAIISAIPEAMRRDKRAKKQQQGPTP